MTLNKWGSLASFLMAAAFIAAPLIYLTGDIHTASGVAAYSLADFLYGPLLAAGLVTATCALRERLGQRAPRRMGLALLAAGLAALGFAAVALIRASNRQYHLANPNMHLENDVAVLAVWTALVTGVNALGFHFLGWTFVLLGSAAWTARQFPRPISILYMLAGVSGWFVYLFPVLEGSALLFGILIGIWQGVLLWKHPAPGG